MPHGPGDAPPPTVSRRERRFEIIATVLLALTAVATAWSGYQASLWDGIQSSNYSRASALRVESAQRFTEANQFRLADLSLFEGYINASLQGQTELADFYRQRFGDDLEPAVLAWEATGPQANPDSPSGPFAMEEYSLAVEEEAQDLADQAHATFDEGENANDYSDTYVATTLFFAAVLFFAAISERFEYVPARVTLLTMAGLGLVIGTGVMLTQPVSSG